MLESTSLPVSGIFTGFVNGSLTECGGLGLRSNYRTMGIKDILARIDRRLEATGETDNSASVKAKAPDFIRNMRRGKVNDVKFGPIRRLAEVLKTTPEWLVDEEGPEEIETQEAQKIPVRGKVGDGGVVIVTSENEVKPIEAPKGSNSKTSAIEIVSDEFGNLMKGWFAIYDDTRRAPAATLLGQNCVLLLTDGRMFVCRLAKGRGTKFTLESNRSAPLLNVDVQWAAKVKTMVPR
jgi:hypothetical protein